MLGGWVGCCVVGSGVGWLGRVLGGWVGCWVLGWLGVGLGVSRGSFPKGGGKLLVLRFRQH